MDDTEIRKPHTNGTGRNKQKAEASMKGKEMNGRKIATAKIKKPLIRVDQS